MKYKMNSIKRNKENDPLFEIVIHKEKVEGIDEWQGISLACMRVKFNPCTTHMHTHSHTPKLNKKPNNNNNTTKDRIQRLPQSLTSFLLGHSAHSYAHASWHDGDEASHWLKRLH